MGQADILRQLRASGISYKTLSNELKALGRDCSKSKVGRWMSDGFIPDEELPFVWMAIGRIQTRSGPSNVLCLPDMLAQCGLMVIQKADYEALVKLSRYGLDRIEDYPVPYQVSA